MPDFRFHKGAEKKETGTLREIQTWAEETRLNAIDLLEMIGDAPPKFPESLYAMIDTNVEQAASSARQTLALSIEWQTSLNAANRLQFPDKLRSALERIGVLVLRHSSLRALHTRGICLFAEPLPMIVFGNESPGAQAFTLAHEFGHIILRQSAISGPPRFGGTQGIKRIEDWCNRFAGAFLMPAESISADMRDVGGIQDSISDERLSALANRYAVSRHAMLIRLVTLRRVKPAFYWLVKRPEFLRQEEEYQPFGRPAYFGSRYRSSRGDFYTGLVLEAWNRGDITNHNAAEFMGIKNLRHLNDIRDNFAG